MIKLTEEQGKKLSVIIEKTNKLCHTIGRVVLLSFAILLIVLLLTVVVGIGKALNVGSLVVIVLTLALFIGGSFAVQHIENDDLFFY